MMFRYLTILIGLLFALWVGAQTTAQPVRLYLGAGVVSATNPLPVSGSVSANVTFPSSQTVNQGTSPWITSGTVSNFPAVQVVSTSGTVLTSGVVNVLNFPATQAVSFGAVAISNFPLVQEVSGTVQIGNFPASFSVSQGTTPWVVSGSVSANVVFPTSQTVNQGSSPWIVSGSTFVQNFPAIQATSATGVTQVSGTVFVQNVVTTSAAGVTSVSGIVAVQNFPSVQIVTTSGTTAISGSVSVLNFPSLQQVSGTITALQGTSPWQTSGTVFVQNIVPISATGITQVSGTVFVQASALPSGAATSANQISILNQVTANGLNAVSASSINHQDLLGIQAGVSFTQLSVSGTNLRLDTVNTNLEGVNNSLILNTASTSAAIGAQTSSLNTMAASNQAQTHSDLLNINSNITLASASNTTIITSSTITLRDQLISSTNILNDQIISASVSNTAIITSSTITIRDIISSGTTILNNQIVSSTATITASNTAVVTSGTASIINSMNSGSNKAQLVTSGTQFFDMNTGAPTSSTLRTVTSITDESGVSFTDINYLPIGQNDADRLKTEIHGNYDDGSDRTVLLGTNGELRTLPKGLEDAGNSTTTPLAAGASFTGTWVKVTDYAAVTFTVASNVSSVSGGIDVQWSADGINVDSPPDGSDLIGGSPRAFNLSIRGRYFRLIYTNGPTPQTYFRIGTDLHPIGTGFVTRPLSRTVTKSNFSQLVRSVSTGENADGIFDNVRIGGTNAANSSTTNLGANGIFRGIWFPWQGPYVGAIVDVKSNVSGTLFIDYSEAITPVNGNDASVDDSEVVPYNPAITPIANRIVPTTTKWFRTRYVNNGVSQTMFSLDTALLATATPLSQTRLDDVIVGTQHAGLVQSQGLGVQPDGDYVKEKADGVLFINNTPLASGASFTSPIFDTDGWRSVELTISTDQQSASNGVVVEFIEDTQAVSPVVRSKREFTFGENDVIQGHATFRFGVQLDGLRVRYLNGPVSQTTFFIEADLRTNIVESPSLAIESTINPTANAILNRSVIAGKREDNAYGNTGLSNTNSLKVAITDRPSEVRSRVKVEKQIFRTSLTAANTLIHTVTPGKTFYLTSFIMSAINNANAIGEFRVRDSSTDKFGFVTGEKTVGAAAPADSQSPNLPEPIPFTSAVNVNEVSGDIQLSFYIIGYEE